jgi:hypothetical protein
MPFQVASLNPCPVCGAETAIAFAGVCLVGAGGGFAPGPAQPATNVATAAPTAAPKPTDYVVKCNEKTITSELTQLSQLAS